MRNRQAVSNPYWVARFRLGREAAFTTAYPRGPEVWLWEVCRPDLSLPWYARSRKPLGRIVGKPSKWLRIGLGTGSRPVSTNLSAPAGIQSPAASVCPSDFSVDSLRDPAANRKTLQLVAPSNARAVCFSVRCRYFLVRIGNVAKTSQSGVVIRRRCLRRPSPSICQPTHFA